MGINKKRAGAMGRIMAFLLTVTITSAQILTHSVNVYAMTGEVVLEDCDIVVEETSDEETVIAETVEEEAVIAETADEETIVDAEGEEGGGSVTFTTTSGTTEGTLSDDANGITVSNSDAGALTVTISKSGAYILTGNAVNTLIEIKKGTTGVTLNLNDLTVDDSGLAGVLEDDASVIAAKSGSEVVFDLAGTNNIIGSTGIITEAEAVIKGSSSTLTFTGTGTLNISNANDDAIKAKNGTINILAGTLNISEEIYGDGIQAENVNISGGDVNITTVFNNAATSYYTSGSSSTTLNTITEKNDKYKTERINVNTGDHSGIKAGTKASTRIYKDLQTTDPDNATKTYDASGGLVISGGNVTINTLGAGLKAGRVTGYTACDNGTYIVGSPDDALHSNNSLSITGGTVILYASDDGITAEGDMTITGSDTVVDIRSSFEGIEGSNITFGTSGSETGPSVSIVSDDDGINAAHKANVTYTYDSSENEDCNYTKTTEKTGGNKCTVYSGTVTINIDSTSTKTRTLRDGSGSSSKDVTYRADGDGIDCNGTLNLEGGTTLVFGASPSTSNSPIDTDEGFTLGTSAVLLAAGSDGMNESKPQNGGGTYIYYGGSGSTGTPGTPGTPGDPGNFNGPSAPGTPGGMPGDVAASISAGSVFKVISGNSVLTEATLPYAASFLIYASPALAASENFTATLNGSAVSMTRTVAGETGSEEPVGPVGPIGPVGPDKPTEPEQPVVTIPVKKIKLNATKVSLGVGRTYQLSVASVTPADASSKVTWSSADNSIASVDRNTGIVTAVSTGVNKKGIPNKTKTVKITATAADGSGKTAVCTVTVGNAVTAVGFYVNGDKTKTTVEDTEVARSKKIKLIPVYTTTYSSLGMTVPMNKKLIWSSSDESVAKVSSSGIVTGLKRGEVTITAKTSDYAGCADGGDVVANCKVTVIVPVTSAKLKKVISIKQGEQYDMNLNLVVLPLDAQYSVKWSTSDDSVVSVDENTGVVTASTQKTGTAKISATVTSRQGKYLKTITKNVKVIAKR